MVDGWSTSLRFQPPRAPTGFGAIAGILRVSPALADASCDPFIGLGDRAAAAGHALAADRLGDSLNVFTALKRPCGMSRKT
jgi:hypothetical protein